MPIKPQFTYSLFIRNNYIGDGKAEYWCMAKGNMIHNFACFCEGCGEVWARVVSENADSWKIHTSPCDHCGVGRIPIEVLDSNLNRAPRKWLEREFLIATQFPSHYWDNYFRTFENMALHFGGVSDDYKDIQPDYSNVPEF